jgi:hypothetical protein
MTNGLPQVKIFALAANPREAGTLYAGAFGSLLNGVLFKSTNAGGTWTAVNQGLENFVVIAIAIDPGTSTTIYVGTMAFGPAPGLPPPSGAVFKSADAGATWSKGSTGLTSTRGVTPPVNALAIDPASPTHVYAGTAGAGVFQSTDGAATWTPINRGLTDLNVQSLQLTPAPPTVLLYAGTSSGVFKSTSDGASEAFIGTLPVVITAPGQLGAMFRTALQLSNPADPCAPPCPGGIFGHIVLHPAGVFTAADPAFTFAIAPGASVVSGDIVGLFGRGGLGSLDIFVGSATEPTVLATLANVGVGGNYGFGERLVRPGDILATGDVGVLIAPGVPNHRLNVGIRTFDTPVVLRVSVRSASGLLMRTLTKQYPAAYMEQVAASTFLDSLDASPPGAYAIGLSDSLRIQVLAGSLVIYGADADNQTNDPSLQVVERVR